MTLYYDDNYGVWDTHGDDPEMVDFYHQTQKQSIWKECRVCGRKVKIRKDYSMCNRCADRLERGLDCY